MDFEMRRNWRGVWVAKSPRKPEEHAQARHKFDWGLIVHPGTIHGVGMLLFYLLVIRK